MPRTQRTLRADEPRCEIIDTLLLKFDERSRQQGFAFGGKGTCVEFDFPEPPRLRTDDLLVLDDGKLVEVVADAEPVLEIRAKDFAAVARFILALGNRHEPVQILTNRVRVLRTPETEALAAEFGIEPVVVTAPFDPHDDAAPGHHHEHDHGHTHHHHGHRHGHDHGHRHDHDHHEHHDRDHHHGHHDHKHHDDGQHGHEHHQDHVHGDHKRDNHGYADQSGDEHRHHHAHSQNAQHDREKNHGHDQKHGHDDRGHVHDRQHRHGHDG